MKRTEELERTRSENGTQKFRQYTDRQDPLLMKAIEVYQSKYKKKFGKSPSRSKLFASALLDQNDEIRAIYEQLKGRVKHAKASNNKPSEQGPRTEPSERF